MKKIFILSVFIILSCNSKSKKENVLKKSQNNLSIEIDSTNLKVIGDKYFKYDEITHYQNDFKEVRDLFKNQHKSKIDSLRMGFGAGFLPKNIYNEFENDIKMTGFKGNKIESKKFEEIDKIFIEKKHLDPSYAGCIYVYRDILVFKRKSKVIGIAKICFNCGANWILGTKAKTDEFGQNGDYDKLYKVLYGKEYESEKI